MPASAGKLTCYTCGSSGHLYAQCPLQQQSGWPRTSPRSNLSQVPAGVVPAIAPASRVQLHPPPGGQLPAGVVPAITPASRVQPRPPPGGQDPCMIFNDKGRCFHGPRCPYTHTCLYCGGQHAKRVCPALRT